MSKSLGNYYTLRDILEKHGYQPEAVRYLLESVPYRKQLNFTFDGLKSANTAIDRLRNFKLRLDTERFPEGTNERVSARTTEACKAFREGMNDDLNTAEALGAVFEYIRDANSAMDSGEFRSGNTQDALDLLGWFDQVFEVLEPTPAAATEISEAEVEGLITERNSAKKAKNFARSDEIRGYLLDRGVILEDTKAGVRWKRKTN
jgi:cysteinyl-tRNA synthetase